MEITARRSGEQLVLALTGRMDGTGAQQVAFAIQQNLNDNDTSIIFDLEGVDYLSSAGLRVFQESIRKMKERKGQVAVCRLQEFTEKILRTAGFLPFLSVYPAVEEALGAAGKKKGTGAGEVRITGNGWSLSAEHLADKPCTLAVTGDLQAIYNGKAILQDVQATRGWSDGFCVGIGALGKDRDSAAPLVGEMISIGGTVYWIPTDGFLTPDFFTAADLESSDMKPFSLFNVAFNGPFTDMVRITSQGPEGTTLTEVYEAIFRYMKQQYPGFKGVCALAMKATIGGLCSSDLKTSLLAASADLKVKTPVAMPGGKTVTGLPFDRYVPEKISVVDVTPKYSGDVLISVGYGIDLAVAQKAFSEESISPLVYPDIRKSGSGTFQYTKGAVFTTLSWDNAADFGHQMVTAPSGGEFVAMHNLLSITRVKSAHIGIVTVSAIKKEK